MLLFFGLDWLEKQNRKPETRGDLRARYENETVTINGAVYRRRKNLTTILLLGIDQPAGNANEPDDFHSGGNADFLRLVVIDSAEKTVSQIQIDRDTIVPVSVLNLIGERTGTRLLQIALSHSYGDGKEQSFITAHTLTLLSELSRCDNIFFAPVTTRSYLQYKRIDLHGCRRRDRAH